MRWDNPYSTPKSGKRLRVAGAVEDIVASATGSSTAGKLAGAATAAITGEKSRKKSKSKTGRSIMGKLGGKLKKKSFKKTSHKNQRLMLMAKGCEMIQEVRMVTKSTTDPKFEAVAIGHTSLPCRAMSLHIGRALIKYVFNALQVYIADFTQTGESLGLIAGDVVRLGYYDGTLATVLSYLTITFSTGNSFEFLASLVAVQLESIQHWEKVRFDLIEFLPTSSASRLTGCILDLVHSRFSGYTKSALKVQNRTVTVAADNEQGDVNQCPVSGKVYHCKGNNFLNKSNRRLLPGVGDTTNLRANELMLFENYSQQTTTVTASGLERYNPIAAQSAFFKVAECPKPSDIFNCVSATKINIEPGEIKTSQLYHKISAGFDKFCTLIYSGRLNSQFGYNERAGHTRVMHLEKTIGQEVSSVAVASECQFECGLALTGKNVRYTIPVTFQQSYVEYESI